MATHRFTWPGSLEQPSCYEHARAAKRIAEAMGFELQILPECLLCRETAIIFVNGSAYCREHAPDEAKAALAALELAGFPPGYALTHCNRQGCFYPPGHDGRHSWERSEP